MRTQRGHLVGRMSTLFASFLISGHVLSGGCGAIDRTITNLGAGAPITIDSRTTPHVMTPDLRTRVFTASDVNTANIYLSDLTMPELEHALTNSGAGATGNLIHIHMFLMPKAGETPVDFTAANATVRHYVIADGAVGLYSGGGFLLPGANPTNGNTLSARLGGATLRLTDASGPFADRLESTDVAGGVTATRDEEAVTAIESRLPMLLGG